MFAIKKTNGTNIVFSAKISDTDTAFHTIIDLLPLQEHERLTCNDHYLIPYKANTPIYGGGISTTIYTFDCYIMDGESAGIDKIDEYISLCWFNDYLL